MRKEISKKSRVIYTFLLIFVTLFLVDVSGFSKFPSTVVSEVLRPIQIGIYKTRNDLLGFLSTLGAIKGLRESEKDLALKNTILFAENAQLKKFGEENEYLREQLGFKTKTQILVPATIIGQDPNLLSSQVLLDVGTKDGIKKGDIAVFKNILIGRIEKVGESSSTLSLLSDSGIKIPSVSEGGALGIVGGNFGNSTKFSKIPQNQEVKKGETVFSTGEAGFPKNLVLGKVGQVKKNAADIFQEAQLESLVSTKQLKAVFIIKEN